MKLYDCSTAPSPRRVRIFLAEKDMDVDLVQVDLGGGEHLGNAFREINADCTVPVLELDDGTRLSEIFAICQYLEELQPEPRLMGRDTRERALVTMWNGKIEQHGLAASAEMFRNHAKGFKGRALTGPHSVDQIPQLVERGRQRVGWFFERLDNHLATCDYIVGDRFTLADITAFVFVEFVAWSRISIGEEQSNLRRWYGEVKSRPAVCA